MAEKSPELAKLKKDFMKLLNTDYEVRIAILKLCWNMQVVCDEPFRLSLAMEAWARKGTEEHNG